MTRLRNKSESSETQTLSAAVLRREEEEKKNPLSVLDNQICVSNRTLAANKDDTQAFFFFFFLIRGILGRRPSEAESGATRCV